MKIDLVHPELRKTIGRVPRLPFHSRLFLRIVNTLSNFAPMPKAGEGVTTVDRKLEHVSVRVYRPAGALSGAGLLWIHGGGMVAGRVAQDDRLCGAYARDLKLVVVSVEYRLAPKYPFPCAIDDCFDAWQWFHASARDLGVDPARIAISGQSAGGGLAASLVQRIFDAGGVQPAAQALFCPMLDDRTGARHELDPIDHRIWNNRSNRAGWSWYLGRPAGEPDVPAYAVAARREDLSGLPSTWIGVGDIDLFHEEDCRYAECLAAAGVKCHLHVAPMAPHAFEALVPDASISRELFQANYRFLCESLGLTGSEFLSPSL